MATTTLALRKEVSATLKRLEKKDPGLKQLLNKAHAYAVFPSVGKAALVIGGAYGKGLVFEKGRPIGHATIGQTTIGVQVGGDTFSEVVVFESKEALDRFKKGKLAFAASASAVLVKAGAAATADFEKGVAVFAYPSGGMLLEASIGGQKFKFKPMGEEEGQDPENSKAGAKQTKSRSGAESEDEGEEQDQGDGEDGESRGLIGRTTGGIGSAASKVAGVVKDHPIAATLIGAGLLGALFAVRAMRSSGANSSGEQDSAEEQDSDEEAGDEDSGEESEEQDSDAEDSGEETEDQSEGEESEEGDDGNQSDEEDEEQDPEPIRRRGRSRA
jgi:hypothetical protein